MPRITPKSPETRAGTLALVRNESLIAPDLRSYDHILVAFSGGKDSLACLLHLLDEGGDPSRIELHHHDVDGRGPPTFDWPITAGYCRVIAESFGVPLYFSWRDGGLRREMLRDGEPTASVMFETPEESIATFGGRGGPGTRLRFPQVTADLRLRWCSSVAKIDVMRSMICNSPRFFGKRTLVVTGERAEESQARARYMAFEPHRTDTRGGPRRPRHVDHWRPILGLEERQVWDLLRRHGVGPHVAYPLGFGRVSCMHCIFASPDQLATIRWMAPERFEMIAEYERGFGGTIKRDAPIHDVADRGRPYPAALARSDLVQLAMSEFWLPAIRTTPERWRLPAGAFGDAAGPG
ncbi:phosphoadenosine phosphosulfate reductase family protein [Methylosinus sp. KRF6]|uniref:phosphoadenosine phosphosulfate reductase domain-containing protein n=1 Tax=Methylosinus sp. KRF6 TaxID=2846853 RepID=UPI001C0B4A50|nr:phosphoadenosine phosphosulfate reductase family protein [Methylosinus sp. KRF6]MBU3887943.1 phosphoadenosine phosphosulfate reductase family protein [Methylosinus sp. KRF6]